MSPHNIAKAKIFEKFWPDRRFWWLRVGEEKLEKQEAVNGI